MDTPMRIWHVAALLSVLLTPLVPSSARAQPARAQPITWAIKVDSPAAGIRAGDSFEAVVAVKMDEGWHVYATDEVPDGPRPLSIALAEHSPFRVGGPLKAPEPTRDVDDAFGLVTASYTISATFRLPVVAPPGLAAGSHDLVVDVAFQACDGRICLPGRTTTLKTTIAITR